MKIEPYSPGTTGLRFTNAKERCDKQNTCHAGTQEHAYVTHTLLNVRPALPGQKGRVIAQLTQCTPHSVYPEGGYFGSNSSKNVAFVDSVGNHIKYGIAFYTVLSFLSISQLKLSCPHKVDRAQCTSRALLSANSANSSLVSSLSLANIFVYC